MCHIIGGACEASLRKDLTIPLVETVGGEPGRKVRPVPRRAAQRFVPAPARYRGMVTGEQDRRDVQATPRPRTGEDRPFHQPSHRTVSRAERVVGGGLSIPEHPWQQSADRLDHDQNGRLPPTEHVIPDRHLTNRHARLCVLGHPCVDALIPPAREDQVPGAS